MIDGKRVLALVPARRGSKGLPQKNIRMLHGKPLLAWPVEAARGSQHVDRVVISTDDPEIATVGRAAGADAPFLRPPELATDASPSIEFIRHALQTVTAAGESYDYLVLLEPTSPLTESTDIDAALAHLVARRADADAIVGVGALTVTHPAYAVRVGDDGLLKPYGSQDFASLPRRQDLDPLFFLDGSLYISDVDTLLRKGGFHHERTLPFVTPRYKSFEVDDLLDFICVEALVANREALRSSDPG